MSCQRRNCLRSATVIRTGKAICPQCWTLAEYKMQQTIAHSARFGYDERERARRKVSNLRRLLRELHQPERRSA